MSHGRYSDARKILYLGARAMADSPDGGLGNHCGVAELFTAWAVCEWYLDNLSRAEVLFDHALRLTSPGDEGSALRSYILYSIALLEYNRGEHHLAQHCISLCLKENAMPGGNSKVWSLWAKLAREKGDDRLAQQCAEQCIIAEEKGEGGGAQCASLTAMTKADMKRMMRKDPWHYKIFDLESTQLSDTPFSWVSLPGDDE